MSSITSLTLCTQTSAAGLQKAIDTVLDSGAHSLLIMACAADHWHEKNIDAVLQKLDVPVIGGCFPNIIYDGRHYEHGTLVVGLEAKLEVLTITALSSEQRSMEERIRNHHSGVLGNGNLITIVDGLAKNIERFVEGLYTVTGVGRETIGCGAGSLDFVQKPCLFSNQGLIQDAAMVATYQGELRRGVNHGWEILDGPYLVTGSEGNVLESLNYHPAFDIYRQQVEAASGLSFDNEDFFAIAKTYPLGIEKLGGEILVRDPIQLSDKSLVCVGEVPENAMVYLLKGQSEHLIESAGQAARAARESYSNNGQVPSALIFDCISRVLFLGDRFGAELQCIESQLGKFNKAFGALTLGEISNTHNGPIDLLNKSTVVAVF